MWTLSSRGMSGRLHFEPGYTPLMKAVMAQNIDEVTALIESGVDLEARDRLGRNVLYHAIPDLFDAKAYEILRLLVSNGVNLNSSLDGDGCSALITAVVLDTEELISFLLDNDVNVNESALSKFWSSLTSDLNYQMGLVENRSATSQFIFSKGCGHNVTPLLCAVMLRHHSSVQKLLQANAQSECLSFGTFWRASGDSVCSNCDIHITPLHMSAYIGDLKVTYELLKNTPYNTENNSSQNFLSFNDITPLWFAVLEGHEDIVKLFLNLGDPVAPPCHFGSGLQVCLQEGHEAIALMLLRAGYDLEEDIEWIERKCYPTENQEVIDKIESLAGQPRPLLDWCCSSLRRRFGLDLDWYLQQVGAPKKMCDILNFNDLSKVSWRLRLKELSLSQD